MRNDTDLKKYIPLDKSWIIRMGFLDILNGYDDIKKFLNKQKNLGDDLIALGNISKTWRTNKPVNVNESGTLLRIFKFASWKLKLNKKFVIKGTLKGRKIKNDSKIINLPQKELLKLDGGTSQWVTAAALLGDKERLKNPPYKLKLTYNAVSYWQKQRLAGKTWFPRFDQTILNQTKTYLKLLKGEKAEFNPEQAEDFCFAYVFGFITVEEGEKRWPSLRNHESDRISEMKKVLEQVQKGKTIISKDHRVIQAIIMWGKVNKKEINIKYPLSVNKSWPQFWEFIGIGTL